MYAKCQITELFLLYSILQIYYWNIPHWTLNASIRYTKNAVNDRLMYI